MDSPWKWRVTEVETLKKEYSKVAFTLSAWIVARTPSFVRPAVARRSNSLTSAAHVAFAMLPDSLFMSTGSFTPLEWSSDFEKHFFLSLLFLTNCIFLFIS